MSTQWFKDPVKPIDRSAEASARARQAQLTKPAGSLGSLEEVAVRFAGWQGCEKPQLQRPVISVFAADHGVADEGVSAFPQAVTAQMVQNFSRGGAAISVLARRWGAGFEVVNLGTVVTLDPLPGVVNSPIAPGTANFAKVAAMDEGQLLQALEAGRAAAQRAVRQEAQLFIGGEMGIANTTAATAMAAALLDCPVQALVGPGTGVDAQGVAHKARVIETALALHRDSLSDPLQVLRHLGGFEIAGLTGAYIAAAQAGIPSLVDGFITTAAALVACRINPGVRQWLQFSHGSAEPGHRRMLEALDAEPLLLLGMRLGEGSGAGVTLPLLQSACALHSEMATFAEAAVASG